jgi:hypothetical protein
VTTADEQLDDGADAIEQWADATAPQPPTQPETHDLRRELWVHNVPPSVNRGAETLTMPTMPTINATTIPFPNSRTKPLTDQVVWWLQAHSDQDLTVDDIQVGVNRLRGAERAEGVSDARIKHALYAIRQRHGDYALHLELGGHQRRGHVRWWTDPSRRPTPDRKWRPPVTVAADRRKRVKDLKRQRQLDVPTPTRAETKPPEPEPEPTPEYVELGALADGRVLLTANGDLYLATRYRPGMP